MRKNANSSKLIYARVLSEFNKGTPPKETLAVCLAMFENQQLADQHEGVQNPGENAMGTLNKAVMER
jgi:hypothetical protein